MRVKNINLKLVTSDLGKVNVILSNWDALKLFDNVEHNINENSTPYTQNAGINRVLKQSSDLGGTTNYKFNKIKL
jgi:putative IMPACT (imprinted ancient) family translation regulator